MPTINKIIISGLVVRDPELKVFNEKAMTKITIASEYKGYKQEEPAPEKKEVCYVDVTFWGDRAKQVAQNLVKGSPVVVEGRLKLESWDDKKTGEKRYKHVIFPEEIIFVDSADKSQPQQTISHAPASTPKPTFVKPTAPAVKHPRIQEEEEFNDLPF